MQAVKLLAFTILTTDTTKQITDRRNAITNENDYYNRMCHF
jgi:hypothetical protein